MPAFLLKFTIKDYVIAGLGALCVLLMLNTYLFVSLGPIGFEGWKPKVERLQTTIDQFDKAQEDARKLAEKQRLEEERKSRERAERTDDATDRNMRPAMDATERFIVDNRVWCPENRSAAGATTTSPGNHGTKDGNGPGAAAELAFPDLVLVKPDDIRICTTNTIRLEEARKWGLELEQSR